MRLIDADKLKIKHFVQRGDQPIGYEGTQPVYEYTDLIAYDVDNAPTVKAIPIEWLINKCNEADNMGWGIDDWSEKDCYIYVFEQWEKENETD